MPKDLHLHIHGPATGQTGPGRGFLRGRKGKGTRDTATRAAGILFLIQNTEKFLLLRRGPHGDHPGTWGVPAGHVEFGESPEQAAIREVYEETGYVVRTPLVVLNKADGFMLFGTMIPAPFEVKLDPESTDYLWTSENHPNLHPGLAKFFASL